MYEEDGGTASIAAGFDVFLKFADGSMISLNKSFFLPHLSVLWYNSYIS
jgi:hypothetical protein